MPEVVSIIACGPSALHTGAERAPGYVIAVNDAACDFRRDCVFTMDGVWLRERGTKYFPRAYAGVDYFARRSAFKFFEEGPARLPHFKVFECDNETDVMSTQPLQFNGRNSGACALNLAFQMTPRTIFLYGFDMGEPTHYFGDYPWKGEGNTNNRGKFAIWREGLKRTASQFRQFGINVYNTNPGSSIRAFNFGVPG